MGLKRLLASLGWKQRNLTLIFLDNQSVIALIKNPKFHARNKHIDIQIHFVRKQMQVEEFKVEHCNIQNMISNIFTKVLSR